MSDRAGSKYDFVCCHLTKRFGISGGWGKVCVYHKTFLFLSSAVFQEHSFSGCKLCPPHFCDPLLTPLPATKLVALPQGISLPMLHSAPSWVCLLLPLTLLRLMLLCVLQQSLGCAFSVLSNGNGSWHCSISGHVWASDQTVSCCLGIRELPDPLCVCVCWPVSPAWGGLAATRRGRFCALPRT